MGLSVMYSHPREANVLNENVVAVLKSRKEVKSYPRNKRKCRGGFHKSHQLASSYTMFLHDQPDDRLDMELDDVDL